MSRNRINKLLSISLVALVMTISGAGTAIAKHSNSYVFKSKGMVATGFNRLLGKPLMSLGSFGRFGYSTLGAFNRKGDSPHRLTHRTTRSSLLATYVDDAFLDSFQGEYPYTVDPLSLNVPLRDVPSNVDVTGLNFQKIPPITKNETYTQFKPGQAFPFSPIHLKQWLKAKGKMTIKCKKGKVPVVKLSLSNLIPNRFYSVWAFFDSGFTGFPMNDFGPVRPLGGLPNMIVTNYSGKATFKRALNFCPLDLQDGEVPLSTIFVMFHSNQQFGGVVPTFPETGKFPGNAAHVHLHFPVSAN